MSDVVLIYRCTKCRAYFLVPDEDPQVHLLKDSMKCPNQPRCQGTVKRTGRGQLATNFPNTKNLSAVALYQASLGIGLPSERNCSPKEAMRLMRGSIILHAELQEAPDPSKSVLLSLTLSSGKVLHLSSSTKGAVIYKVTDVENAR